MLVQYLPLYSDRQARRHEVKPGMTGWAQVNGRNAISWEQKFDYDVWYVDNLSLWLDIKILFLTVKRVFFRDGINAGSDVTMEPLKGAPCHSFWQVIVLLIFTKRTFLLTSIPRKKWLPQIPINA